jgi:hypothetical protein
MEEYLRFFSSLFKYFSMIIDCLNEKKKQQCIMGLLIYPKEKHMTIIHSTMVGRGEMKVNYWKWHGIIQK